MKDIGDISSDGRAFLEEKRAFHKEQALTKAKQLSNPSLSYFDKTKLHELILKHRRAAQLIRSELRDTV